MECACSTPLPLILVSAATADSSEKVTLHKLLPHSIPVDKAGGQGLLREWSALLVAAFQTTSQDEAFVVV